MSSSVFKYWNVGKSQSSVWIHKSAVTLLLRRKSTMFFKCLFICSQPFLLLPKEFYAFSLGDFRNKIWWWWTRIVLLQTVSYFFKGMLQMRVFKDNFCTYLKKNKSFSYALVNCAKRRNVKQLQEILYKSLISSNFIEWLNYPFVTALIVRYYNLKRMP